MTDTTRQILYYIILLFVAGWLLAGIIFYFSGWQQSILSPAPNIPRTRPLVAEDAALLQQVVTAKPKPLSSEDQKALMNIVSAKPATLDPAEHALVKKVTGQ